MCVLMYICPYMYVCMCIYMSVNVYSMNDHVYDCKLACDFAFPNLPYFNVLEVLYVSCLYSDLTTLPINFSTIGWFVL